MMGLSSLKSSFLPGRGPGRPRAGIFFDGRNSRHAAEKAFGDRRHAEFHPGQVAARLCARQGWRLDGVHLHVGIPQPGRLCCGESAEQWAARIELWEQDGVRVCSRPLVGNNRERGIDLRMGYDMVRAFEDRRLDVVVIASADQDFQEAVLELKDRAACLRRRVLVATAFPSGPGRAGRGVDTADLHLPLDASYFAAAPRTRAAPGSLTAGAAQVGAWTKPATALP